MLTGVVESSRNMYRDPMLRSMLELVKTPYVVFMDDDSHVRGSWIEPLHELSSEQEDPGCGRIPATHLRRHDACTAWSKPSLGGGPISFPKNMQEWIRLGVKSADWSWSGPIFCASTIFQPAACFLSSATS